MDDGPAVGDGKALVLSAPKVELAVVFLARAQLRFGRSVASAQAQRLSRPHRVLVGQQDIPIIIGLPQSPRPAPEQMPFRSHRSRRGSDTGDFHFADKGLRKGGLALLKQASAIAATFFPVNAP